MRNPNTVILRATTAELELARQAVAKVNLPTSHYCLPPDETALRKFLADPGHYLILAIQGGMVVGSLYGYALQHPHRPEPQFFLYGIDVRPEHRSSGIGTSLVDQFIVEARRAGAFEVWVLTEEANKAAMAMYAHSGLKRFGVGEVMLELKLGSVSTRST